MKQQLLDTAEVADAYRLVPRILICSYSYMLWYTGLWFMALPDPSGPQSAYVAAVWGAAGYASGLYFNSGRKWSNEE